MEKFTSNRKKYPCTKASTSILKISAFFLTCAFTVSGTESFANEISKPIIISKVSKSLKRVDFSGKVVDKQGQPIPGATIRVKGGKAATMTDGEGKFILKDVDPTDILVISYQGYTPKEIPASANLASIQLIESENNLNDVVVVGYGTTKKKD